MSKVLKCSICNYVTTRTYNFNRHKRKHEEPCEISNDKDKSAVNPDSPNVNPVSPNVNPDSSNVNPVSPNVNPVSPNVNPVSPNVNSNPEETVTPVNKQFPCPKCCKIFMKKCSLDNHVSKCVGVQNSLTCPLCKKTFNTRQGKCKHMKICKGSITSQALTQSATLLEQLPSSRPIIAETANIQNMHNSHNTYNTQNIHITVNSFGSEDESHITKQFQDARLMEFNGRGIYNYAKAVSFNPEKPQNHNIRKRDHKFCSVYENGEWVTKSLTSIMTDIVHMYQCKLRERLYDLDFKLSLDCETTWMQIYENFVKFDRDRNPCDYYRIIRDIVALLENLEKKYSEKQIASCPKLT